MVDSPNKAHKLGGSSPSQTHHAALKQRLLIALHVQTEGPAEGELLLPVHQHQILALNEANFHPLLVQAIKTNRQAQKTQHAQKAAAPVRTVSLLLIRLVQRMLSNCWREHLV